MQGNHPSEYFLFEPPSALRQYFSILLLTSQKFGQILTRLKWFSDQQNTLHALKLGNPKRNLHCAPYQTKTPPDVHVILVLSNRTRVPDSKYLLIILKLLKCGPLSTRQMDQWAYNFQFVHYSSKWCNGFFKLCDLPR